MKNIFARILALVVGLCACMTSSLWAISLFGTADPAANTTPPGGTLANSGWQWEGKFGAVPGTAVGSNFIITVMHVGGFIGQGFVFNGNGLTYHTVAYWDDPASDLRL